MKRGLWLVGLVCLVVGLAMPARAQQAGALVRDAVRAAEAEDFKRAIRLYQEALKLRPQLGDIWLQLGLLQLAEGQYRQARASLAQAIRLNQDPFPAQLAHARSFSWQGDYRKAEAHYRRLLQEHPYSLEALLGLATALQWQERWSQAEQVYRDILDKEPENVEARLAMGNLWRSQDMFVQAEAAYQEILRRDPTHAAARLARARLGVLRRDLGRAQDEVAEVLRTHPDDAEAWLARARLEHLLGEEAKSLVSLKEARRWAPLGRPVRQAWRRYNEDHDPALEPLLRRSRDGDGNHFQSLGARLSFDLDPDQRLSLYAEQQHQTNAGQGLSTDVTLAMVGWRGRVASGVQLRAGLGMAALPGGGRPIGLLACNWTPTLDDSLWVTYSSEVLTDTPQLVLNRVGLQQAGFQFRHAFTDQDSLDVGYQRGFFTDSNTRNLYSASYFHDFLDRPRLSLGAAFRGMDYAFPSSAGYFSPSTYRLTEAVLRLDNHVLDDRWLYSLEAAVGLQHVAGRPDQTVSRFSASLGYRVTDWLELEAGAFTTNSAAASQAGYSYSAETFRAKIRF